MNLLLLLSALLSALSGGTSGRAAQVPTALSSGVVSAVKATAAVQLQITRRPAQVLATPANAADMIARDFALPSDVSTFASRRRE